LGGTFVEGLLLALYLTGMALVVLFFRGVRIVNDDDCPSTVECVGPQGQRARTERHDRA